MSGQVSIIGNGSLAKMLDCGIEREAILFCSGVSNSNCTDEKQFEREREKLYEVRRWAGNECLFYFSSIGVNFSSKPYFRHKGDMEELVKKLFGRYVILRIGNIFEDTNPNTFINFIRRCQRIDVPVEIREEELKYMIDGPTLNMLCQTLPLDQKIEITVATKIAKVRDLL